MSREEIHKLVGGYATGTLTPEEREALFRAALEDQELFDALAREQALCDLLSDPASKAQLLAALEEKPPRWYEPMGWLRPGRLLVPAALAMAGVAVLAVIAWRQNGVPRFLAPQPPLVAEVKPAAPPPAPTETAGKPADTNLAPGGAAASRAAAAPPAPLAAQMRPAEPPAARPALVARGAGMAALSRVQPPPARARFAPLASPPLPPSAGNPAVAAGTAGMAASSGAPPASTRSALPPPPAVTAALTRPPGPTLGGNVTDPSGAVVREATVTVASDNPTVEKQAKTDAQGNWSIEIPRPGQYQVTVDAPGFKPERAGVELQSADSKKVNMRLSPGSTAETVQVTAASPLIAPFQQAETAGQLQPAVQQGFATMGSARGGLGGPAGGGGGPLPSARQLFEEAAANPEARVTRVTTINGALPPFRSQIGPAFGLRYTLVRRASGDFGAASRGDLKAGNTVEIQFTPAVDGYLTVTASAGAVLVATRVTGLKPFTTPPLPQGEKEIAVTYSRQAPAATARDAIDTLGPAIKPLEETVAGVTYVAARTTQGELSFTIKVK